jgi:Ser/Thr protein kinase RdoA (MazF antagonist)
MTTEHAVASSGNIKAHPLVTPDVLAAYQLPADTQIKAFGNGHINKTFLLSTSNKRLILQQINTSIFPSAVDVVQNALKIERHLLAKQQQGLYPLQVLQQQATAAGHHLTGPAGDLRALQFIDHGTSIEVVESPEQAFAAALTFGQFAAALADFDAGSLVTVLPDFHNLAMRFSQLKSAIAADPQGRLAGCQSLVDFCLAQQHLVAELAALCPKLPLRVCHNDTKINNMLYSSELGRGIAAIDLDTCMSGYWLFDFGDMVRTCCSPEAEDSLNTENVRIRPEIFAALAKGYLQGLSGVMTDAERQSLLLGAKVMCLMIGIRFLADHLNGDQYFAIKRDHHNLQRAQNQIRLYQDLLVQQAQLAACFD